MPIISCPCVLAFCGSSDCDTRDDMCDGKNLCSSILIFVFHTADVQSSDVV
jgi:hypothetical protein